MSGAAPITLLFLLFHPLFTNSLTIFASYCVPSSNISSTYRSNVNTLLSTLSSSATNKSFFHSTSISSSVYGLYFCRDDDSLSTCKDCVAKAATTLNASASCSTASVAVIWYAECVLRFSNNATFFVQQIQDVYSIMPTIQNVTTNVTGFNQVLNATLEAVADEASRGGAQLKYATAKAPVYDDGGQSSSFVYALGQCTPDLSAIDCRKCLQACIDVQPVDAQGAWIIALSCVLQYEDYLFYGTPNTAFVAPAPAPAPAPNTSNDIPSLVISSRAKKSSSKVVVGVITGAIAAGLIAIVTVVWLVKRKKEKKKKMVEIPIDNASVGGDDFGTDESLLHDFDELRAATNYFSDDNKIGQGGFGSVYKGKLSDGQEIAVKRLSTSSARVLQDLKNEVILVAKLQHRNLLRLLGFCLAGDEKLLVYEYAPNRSLDTFLFDAEKKAQLDWPTRYKIITGVARGMLYLHEDSQLRVIHRDLKASNVLLDANMNPKISDFGIARIFSKDQTQGSTCRVVGTYGYIAPEYAMHGKFSVKSDAYSFGVLVLEIISGKRTNNLDVSGDAEDLLSYSWKLWSKGTPLELADPVLRNSCSNDEVIRCIHLGLLCVEHEMAKRPSMGKIVLMLNSYSVNLPTPRKPVFIRRRTSANISADKSTSKSASLSGNDVTMTEIDPR